MRPLLKARTRMGLTRKQAAEKIGITVRRLFDWEINGCPRKDWEIKALAKLEKK